MKGIDKRLRRLEGPGVIAGETPEWCAACARQEAALGFPCVVTERAGEIASMFRNHAEYLAHQQCKHIAFIATGDSK